MHQRNLQTLATEIYKAKNKISPEVINSLFEFTKILERRQFLKERDISQSIIEVKVLYPFIHFFIIWPQLVMFNYVN